MVEYAITGAAVKLKASFKTFAGEYADPTGITLKTYKRDKTLIASQSIDDSYKVSTGRYEVPYVVPVNCTDENRDYIYYEFSGTLNGLAVKGRDKLYVRWSHE